MRVKPTEFGEFIEYLDGNGEWQVGARIVMFEAKGMNSAQAYGSALTYARRYTVQMAQAVACDDDDAVEQAKPRAQSSNSNGAKPSDKQLDYLKKLLAEIGKTDDEIAEITSKCKTSSAASVWIEKAKAMVEEVLPTDEEVA